LADIAILVVDVTEGVKPQTIEAIGILRNYKTPFIVAANKVDKIVGWQSKAHASFTETIENQPQITKDQLDIKIYELMGQLAEHKVIADRFDRISDFTKMISIVPICARTGEGIPELLALLTGLTQKYLTNELEIDPNGIGHGTILEVKEVQGLGTTADAIIYKGVARKDDILVIGHPDGPIVTKAKAILKTAPLKEIRVERKFLPFAEIVAAAGLKISANGLENVIAGVPLRLVHKQADVETAKAEVQAEIDEVQIQTDEKGVIVKADALGSLEAMVKLLKEKQIPIKVATIGNVNRKDILTLEEVDPKHSVIFAFNTTVLPDAEEEAKKKKIKILSSNIVYRLLENYDAYMIELETSRKRDFLGSITKPCKLKFLPGFVFRQSKPAVIGMEVSAGSIVSETRIMDSDGNEIGTVKQLQDKGQNISEGTIGMNIAVSIEGGVVGRNMKENEFFYSMISKDDYKKILDNKSQLADHEKLAVEEIKEIMLRKDKRWDVF
jgi:translation initiation factor 5B